MKGIVSLLDDEHSDLVANLWDQLNHEFGLTGVYANPYPHIVWHSAQDYNFTAMEFVLKSIARETAPFTVRTSGLHILTTEPPVVSVAVSRGFEPNQLQTKLWYDVSAAATRIDESLFPDFWMPGISLAVNDVQKSTLPGILWLLGGQNFNWEFTIDNLCYFEDMGGEEARPFLELDLLGQVSDLHKRVF